MLVRQVQAVIVTVGLKTLTEVQGRVRNIVSTNNVLKSPKRSYSSAILIALLILIPICCVGIIVYSFDEREINASILEWQTQNRLNNIYE